MTSQTSRVLDQFMASSECFDQLCWAHYHQLTACKAEEFPILRKKLEVRATKAVPRVVIDPVSLESTVGLENLTGQRKRVETTTETGLSGLFSGEMKTQADDGGQENVTIAGQIS